MATPEENAATCREFVQRVLNEGDISFAEKTLAEGFVDLTPPPGLGSDKASAIEMFRMMSQQFSDSRTEVLDVIASGDKVTLRSKITGTDTNGFMPGMPATGKTFSLESIDVMTFDQNGQNTEHYGVADIAGAMTQLGLMPGPGAEAPG